MKHPFSRHGLVAAALGLVTAGCGGANLDTDQADLGSASEAITGGSLVTANVAPYSSIVHLVNVGCTATKIGSRRFLTAGHCVPNLAPGGVLQVSNALDGVSAADNLTIAFVAAHPSIENVTFNPNLDPRVEGHMSYDVAVIDVTTDTPGIPQNTVNPVVIGNGFITNTVGYGCDNSNPAHSGLKQRASFSAMSLANFLIAAPQTAEHSLDVYIHDIIFDGRTSGRQICPGDSGGPSLHNSEHSVAAVNSQILGGLSYVARTANVRRWISLPQKNIFQNGSGGFLLNAASAKCLASSDPNTPGVVNPNSPGASSVICNAPLQENDLQFWTLETQSPGFFSVVNGSTGNCLASILGFADTDVCNGFDTQGWAFVRVTAANLPAYYRIQNKAAVGICLEVTDLANSGFVAMKPCVDKLAQRWIFTE